jgi:hypothetical protein
MSNSAIEALPVQVSGFEGTGSPGKVPGRGATADLQDAAELALVVGSLNQAHAHRVLLRAIDPHDHLWLHGADAQWLVAAVDALDRGIAMRFE